MQTKPATILFVAANPATTSQIDLGEEVRLIEHELRWAEREVFCLRPLWAARPIELFRGLNHERPAIVHFAGHGAAGGIMLVDDSAGQIAVSGKSLARLFAPTKRATQLVVLNACSTDEQSAALVEVVGCVIAMNSVIGDHDASRFSQALYAGLAAGTSLRDAFDGAVAFLMMHEEAGAPRDLGHSGMPDQCRGSIPVLRYRHDVDPSQIRFLGAERESVVSERPEAIRAGNGLSSVRDTPLRSRPPLAIKDDGPADRFAVLSDLDVKPRTIVDCVADLNRPFELLSIVAHYGPDVDMALRDAHRTLSMMSGTDREPIWVRGDDLLRARSEGPSSIDAILDAVLPGAPLGARGATELDTLMERYEFTFLVTFGSVLPTDLDPGLISSEAFAWTIGALRAFARLVCGRAQCVVVGIPRLFLGFSAWRELVVSQSRALVAVDLYEHVPDLAPCESIEQVPEPLRDLLAAMLRANSGALRRRAKKLASSWSGRTSEGVAARPSLVSEVLDFAAALERDGFLEPALRLEIWLHTRGLEAVERTSAADLLPFPARDVNACEPGAYEVGTEECHTIGLAEELHELPQIASRILVTGQPGLGKTTLLRQIERFWSMPRRHATGRRFPAWLPIFIDKLTVPVGDLERALLRGVRWTLPEQPGRQRTLPVHTRLAAWGAALDLRWALGSPLLVLVDRQGTTLEGEAVARWSFEMPPLCAVIMGYSGEAEFPREEWFHQLFAGGIHARLRPLDAARALAYCRDGAARSFVERALSRIDEPLGQHLRNPFVLGCVLRTPLPETLPQHTGLHDLLELHIETRLAAAEEFDPEALAWQLRELAASRLERRSAQTDLQLVRGAVRLGLLAGPDAPQFTHILIEQFFAASYLAEVDAEDGWRRVRALLQPPAAAWEDRHGALLRILVKRASRTRRTGLVELLASAPELAHHCLRELSPEEYASEPAAETVRARLTALIRSGEQHGAWAPVLRRRETAAEALGFYDERLAAIDRPADTLIPIPFTLDGVHSTVMFARFPVTNLEFARFIADGGYARDELWTEPGRAWRRRNRLSAPAFWTHDELNRPNKPVVGVSIYEALAYVRWLDQRPLGDLAPGIPDPVYALPTSAEWLLAAGVVAVLAGPTGAVEFSRSIQATIQDGLVTAMSPHAGQLVAPGNGHVGLFPPSPRGTYDMLGNVWEWCDEWFSSDFNTPPSVAGHEWQGPARVHGGPVRGPARVVTSLLGSGLDPFSRVFSVGFRICCRSASLRIDDSRLFDDFVVATTPP